MKISESLIKSKNAGKFKQNRNIGFKSNNVKAAFKDDFKSVNKSLN